MCIIPFAKKSANARIAASRQHLSSTMYHSAMSTQDAASLRSFPKFWVTCWRKGLRLDDDLYDGFSLH
jgi:hypothetical protein